MKNAEIVSLTDVELQDKLVSLKQELFNLRFSHATGSLANPLQLRECKRNIARVKTALKEREHGIAKSSPKAEAKPAKVTKKASVKAGR